MNCIKKIVFIAHLVLMMFFLSSCSSGNSIQISKKEYSSKKGDGFWVIRNKKAINYNQEIAKPKRDKQMKKLARQNKHIEKLNSKQNNRFRNNETLHKTYDHH